MKGLYFLRFAILTLTLLIILKRVQSNQNDEDRDSDAQGRHTIDILFQRLLQWRTARKIKSHEESLKLSLPIVLSGGVLCFLAASISSAGGIGGGGLFIPILKVVAGLDLKTASSFSAFMVTGGSIANVLYNSATTSTGSSTPKPMIDFDIALLSEPGMLLGVSAGVVLNLVLPDWLITISFAAFLSWSTFKTCRNGVSHWRLESRVLLMYQNGIVKKVGDDGGGVGLGRALLDGKKDGGVRKCSWMKFGVFLVVWLSFCVLYLIRGNRYGKGIIEMEPCGVGYWTLSLIQIPMAILFTAWILHSKHKINYSQVESQQVLYKLFTIRSYVSEALLSIKFVLFKQDIADFSSNGLPNELIFPLMALLAGVLGGVFGIGGGMLISPLLLEVGVAPEVTAATCSFMVCFSSTMSAFQYLLLGMENIQTALILSFICFMASLIGLAMVQRIVRQHGRPSVIVFLIGTVMALSAVLMTSFGAIDVWNDYISGSYMGFSLPC